MAIGLRSSCAVSMTIDGLRFEVVADPDGLGRVMAARAVEMRCWVTAENW